MVLNFSKIEKKWQQKYEEAKTFEANPVKGKPKFFVTFPYPYMNSFLHVGHFYTIMRVEAMARYKRMQGYNVLFPQGWHCTGSPIENAAKRIAEKESTQWEIMHSLGLSDTEIEKFVDPKKWVKFFPNHSKNDFNALGISVDWRRSFITTSLNPHYDKFIQWQFRKLYEKKYVVKGKHAVVWCIKDNSPVPDHNRVEGEGETPQEMVLLKFELGNEFLVAATLRPETVFGQTNLWLDPELEYSKALVDGKEIWIASKEFFGKLQEQGHSVQIKESVKGKKLLGKEAIAPMIEKPIPILPAYFCDPNKGTGIVTSVPSDAPDDWIGLQNLQENKEECEKFGLDYEKIKSIKPIAIIDSEDLGNMAAVKICKDMSIKNQHERKKLEEAKKIVYKKGFYAGKMNKNCKKYAGMPVTKAKDLVKDEIVGKGQAAIFYELTGKIVCRCLEESIVKIVSDQWFVKYSDPLWKKQCHKALDKLRFYPGIAKNQFNYVIDWLNDWPCTREFGLGTKLPWDDKWVIESLSDSTIYMAFYTIAHILQTQPIENINDALFDFVFLGKKNKNLKVDKATVEKMKTEFEYFYPVDFRNSGKDLIQNHLTFFLFNHCTIFPEKYWPEGIGVNGWVTVNGEKMSKSKGNFILMRDLPKKFGVDASRFTTLNSGEGLSDTNFEIAAAKGMSFKLEQLYNFCIESYNKGHKEKQDIDKWLESKLNEIIRNSKKLMDEALFKSALQLIFFELQNAIKWYLRRTNNRPNKETLNKIIEIQVLLLSPFCPFICEEIWEKIGKKDFVAKAEWPKYNEKNIKQKLNQSEELIRTTMQDINAIKKITKIQHPKKITIYPAPGWKRKLLHQITSQKQKTKLKDIMSKVAKDKELREYIKEIPSFIQQLDKKIDDYTNNVEINELELLQSAKEFLQNEFNCEIVIEKKLKETPDLANHTKKAMPFKPAIFIE